jgi:hypothetical protein
VTTNAADAQMYPPIAGLQAFLAALGAWFDILYLIEMSAVAHEFSPIRK